MTKACNRYFHGEVVICMIGVSLVDWRLLNGDSSVLVGFVIARPRDEYKMVRNGSYSQLPLARRMDNTVHVFVRTFRAKVARPVTVFKPYQPRRRFGRIGPANGLVVCGGFNLKGNEKSIMDYGAFTRYSEFSVGVDCE